MTNKIEKRIEISAPVSRVWRTLTGSREFGGWFRVKMDDYSQETPTRVEFSLAKTSGGTLLVLTESGFDKLPKERYADVFRMNSRGWEQQLDNIQAYVSKTS